MKQRSIFAGVAALSLLVGPSFANMFPVFSQTEPGLYQKFDDKDPDGWGLDAGRLDSGVHDYTSVPGSLVVSYPAGGGGGGARVLYNATGYSGDPGLPGSTGVVPMAGDWILHYEVMVDYVTPQGAEDDIFGIAAIEGGGPEFRIRGPGWHGTPGMIDFDHRDVGAVSALIPFAENVPHTIDVTFIESTGLVNAWVDGAQAVTDYAITGGGVPWGGYLQLMGGSADWVGTVQHNDLQWGPIPEPGTLAMLLIGGGLLSIARRFRR